MTDKTNAELRVGFFRPEDVQQLSRITERLKAATGGRAAETQEVSIAFPGAAGADQSMAVSYRLGSVAGDIAHTVGQLVALSASERSLLGRLTPTEMLFHWEDEQLPVNARGPSVPLFSAVPIDETRELRLRSLVEEMLRDHHDGLVARARAVGYYREINALVRDLSGRPLYLVYLELKAPDYATVVSNLMSYPPTPFSRWWTPRFIELVGKDLVSNATSNTVLRYSASE